MDITRKRLMPRILRNRSSYLGRSKAREPITIESVVKRIHNTFRVKSAENNCYTILTHEIPKSVNFKVLRNISRKRKQKICLEHLGKSNFDWTMYVPKNLLEMEEEKYEKSEIGNTVRKKSKDVVETSSVSDVPWEDSSVDFWNVDMDDWTNVQEVVDVESETIDNGDNDELESSVIPLISRSGSSKFCSIKDSKWIDVEVAGDDKLVEISTVDFGNNNYSVLDASKDVGPCWNKTKKGNTTRVNEALSQENRKLELLVKRNCYFCRFCNKKYRYKFSLHRHLKRTHGYDNETVLGSSIFTCNLCLKNYRRLGNFINHTNIHTEKDKIPHGTLRF